MMPAVIMHSVLGDPVTSLFARAAAAGDPSVNEAQPRPPWTWPGTAISRITSVS